MHVVVEYAEGLEFNVGGESVRTSRNNRFIFSYDETNAALVMDAQFAAHAGELVRKNWVCLISGFHLVEERYITD